MPWFTLVLAGAFEVAFAASLKRASVQGEIAWVSSALAALLTSVGLLGASLQHLPLHIAYPIWTTIGVAGSVLVSLGLYGERINLWQATGLVLILCGVAVLYAATTDGEF